MREALRRRREQGKGVEGERRRQRGRGACLVFSDSRRGSCEARRGSPNILTWASLRPDVVCTAA
eukprot:2159805-Rhodomonas_salina.2